MIRKMFPFLAHLLPWPALNSAPDSEGMVHGLRLTEVPLYTLLLMDR